MKKIKFIAFLLFTAMLSVNLSSCCLFEEDDEPDNPQSSTQQVDNYGITMALEVDLGLPSGLKWAGWNIGASSPEDAGDYFAWGEVNTKNDYTLSTYLHYNESTGIYTDLGANITETKYDVARQKWGGSWRMPTLKEFRELIDNCTWTWINYKNSIYGYKVKGPNGNAIFLPASGNRRNDKQYNLSEVGLYWCSIISSYNSANACYLHFYDDYRDFKAHTRCCGHSIRAVNGIGLNSDE